MKKRLRISIETVLEIYEEDFDRYILALREAGIPIDGKKFSRDREWSYTSLTGTGFATTTYRIVEDETPHDRLRLEYVCTVCKKSIYYIPGCELYSLPEWDNLLCPTCFADELDK